MNKQKIVMPLGMVWQPSCDCELDKCPDWLNCGFDSLQTASLFSFRLSCDPCWVHLYCLSS